MERPADTGSHRPVGGIATAVLAMLIAGALVLVAANRHPQTAAGVVLIGDSITDGLRARPGLALAGEAPQVEAEGGRRVADLMGSARRFAASPRAQVVVNLGTNDLMQGATPADTLAALGTLTDLLDDRSCVHVVTLNDGILDFDQPQLHEHLQSTNAGIATLARQRGYRVVDWNAIVRQHDVEGDPAFPVTSDSIHPTPAGQDLLVAAYDEAVRAGCP